jgi:AcrR family transcriptional regulator
MSKETNVPAGSAVERIMSVATDLFYKQGYRATGINEVIQKSGVAKATFYSHFPSKDDLCQAYLDGVVEYELTMLDGLLISKEGELNKFLAVIEWLKPWLVGTNFRGCAFLHTVAEIPDPDSRLRKPGIELYDGVRARVETLSQELIDSNAKKYGHLDVKELSDEYMVIFAGTIALAEIYHTDWPVEHALKTLRRLIGE